MSTRSEPFASIDGAEGVGIRASSADWEVNIRRAFKRREYYLFRNMSNFRHVEGSRDIPRSYLKAMPRDPSTSLGMTSLPLLVPSATRPFFLAKVCLIPPFSP